MRTLLTMTLVLATTSAFAQLSPDQMRAEMAKNIKMCQNAEYLITPLKEACGGDGNGNTGCGHGSDFDQACGRRFNACYEQWIEDKKTVLACNAWIRDCNKPQQQAKPLPPPPAIKPLPPAPTPSGSAPPAKSEMEQALQRERERAKSADTVRAKHAEEARRAIEKERQSAERAALDQRNWKAQDKEIEEIERAAAQSDAAKQAAAREQNRRDAAADANMKREEQEERRRNKCSLVERGNGGYLRCCNSQEACLNQCTELGGDKYGPCENACINRDASQARGKTCFWAD
jgi:hypothetical protein